MLHSMIRFWISMLGGVSVLAGTLALRNGPQDEERIQELISQLGHDSIEERDSAMVELARMGKGVIPRIERALQDARGRRDAEVEGRCIHLLDRLDPLRRFPMRVGDRWVYASGGLDVAFEVHASLMLGEDECFEVVRSIGEERLPFYLSVREDGVRIHKVGEDAFDPPYREIAFPLESGMTWSWEGKIGGRKASARFSHGGAERVAVPLGTFSAFRVSESLRWEAGEEATTELWLVERIGVVRLSGKLGDLHNNSSRERYTWELKAYTRKEE